MKDKVESTDNIEDFPEDIPFPDGWERIQVDEMKEKFSDWLDDNLQNEYEKDPEFYLKENEKRFYFRVIDEGYTDEFPIQKMKDTDVYLFPLKMNEWRNYDLIYRLEQER